MHHPGVPMVEHYSEEACFGGSILAIGGGLWAAVSESPVLPNPAFVLALGGLVTAFAGLAVPLVRIWIEARTAERVAKWARHDLANRLHEATLTIELNRVQIEEQERRLRDQHMLIMNLSANQAVGRAGVVAPPPPPDPDPAPAE